MEKREWLNTWDRVAQLDMGTSADLKQPPEIHMDDIQNADQARLDELWENLKKYERLVKKWTQHAIKVKRNEEMKRIIDTSPRQGSSLRLFYQQIQRLECLDREYMTVLDNLKEEDPFDIFERPLYLERKLMDSFLLSPMTRNKVAEEICNVYNERRQQ